jgi:hypothetical protein
MVTHAYAWLILNRVESQEFLSMARGRRSQVTVELAPRVKEELERLTQEGSILSVQDFVRRAVDNEISRWKVDHAGPPPADLMIPVPKRK